MKRLATFATAALFCTGALAALGRGASATPPSATPPTWAYQAIDSLEADGVIDGYPEESYRSARPLTRPEMAILVARAILKLQARGAANISKADADTLHRLTEALRDDLLVRGIRVSTLDDILHPPASGPFVKSFQVHGAFLADGSLTQRNTVPHTIGGTMIDPFVNAFLTSPLDDSAFEHAAGPGNLFRVDNRIVPSYAFTRNVSLSLPIRFIQYHDAFGAQDQYLIQPALVLNVAKYGALTNIYIVGGQLENLASSRLGLTYRAPDATGQGPGFQNPVQPYEQGFEVGGVLKGWTRFQASWSAIDQSMIDTIPGSWDEVASNNYFSIVNPRLNSLVQPGAPGSSTGRSRTDSFIASAGPVPAVSLSSKAALGTVFISAVNGTVCNPAGLTPSGMSCPIGGRSWYYVDQTNQVVFRSPLPAGTTVQITYSMRLGGDNSFPRETVQFQREHFNGRLSQQFAGLPGAEIGVSASRIVDSGNFSSQGFSFGTGYGAVSDSVVGVDAALPLAFLKMPGGHWSPELFGEGAASKYTPDFHNTPPITDSALALGLRLKAYGASAVVEYQSVGPNFMDGAPIRYLGPAPATFQFWRGNYFPGFFGFGNNLAINRIFDNTVTPGCSSACTSRSGNLTYIYPVFNPFVATGPQYYSAFAPNTRGLTTTIALPVSIHDFMLRSHFRIQHLQEVDPNGFGQIAYGPGFSSRVRMQFDSVNGDLQFGVPVAGRKVTLGVNGGAEHLARIDDTAYAYVPFNPMTGGPDAASGALLNAFLAGGAIPVLFYPNYIDERHTTIGTDLLVPFARDLTFGLGYNAQNYYGSYANTVAHNIAEHRDIFGASLTYDIPRTSSLLGVLVGNDRYTDYMLPAYNYNQTREDLNFTTRF